MGLQVECCLYADGPRERWGGVPGMFWDEYGVCSLSRSEVMKARIQLHISLQSVGFGSKGVNSRLKMGNSSSSKNGDRPQKMGTSGHPMGAYTLSISMVLTA